MMHRSETLGLLRSRLRGQAVDLGMNTRDVDLLISDALARPLSWLFAHGDAHVDAEALERVVERRFSGEPLQYICGHTEFYGREFLVDSRVLIPRPETELLVEAAVKRVPASARVVDVGTGSGCIAVSLALERPDLHVVGVDASLEALAVAAANRTRLAAGIELLASDLLTSLTGDFDVIVSNPPYIPAAEIAGLATEVRDFEPRAALTPGLRGTEIIEKLMDAANGRLLLMEIGFGQADEVRSMAKHRGGGVELIRDLAGIERVVVLSAHVGK